MNRGILLSLTLLLLACDGMFLGDHEPVVSLEENLKPPPSLEDGWGVSTLAAEDVDEQAITRLITNIHNEPRNIHSLLIIRNNKLVAESYFGGWNRRRLHSLRSVSKSFVSTLFGIARDKGYIGSLDERMASYFPEYTDVADEDISEIRLQHILNMTAGFKWDEKSNNHSDQDAFDRSDHRLNYLFTKEMVSTPGETFVYNSALPVVQAAIIKKATGLDAPSFARDNLFAPLGIQNYYWRTDPNDGLITSIGPLFLCTRDMAKLGQLFLDNGQWKGVQVVSAAWVSEATATYVGNENTLDGYGYNWRTGLFTLPDGYKTRAFFARGSGGQYIFVAPEYNAVVAFTSGNYPPLNQSACETMFAKIILPAMK